MKLYVHDKGILLVGKAWEVRAKLREYNQHYDYLRQFLQDSSKGTKEDGKIIGIHSRLK